jgi:hypothetical protein
MGALNNSHIKGINDTVHMGGGTTPPDSPFCALDDDLDEHSKDNNQLDPATLGGAAHGNTTLLNSSPQHSSDNNSAAGCLTKHGLDTLQGQADNSTPTPHVQAGSKARPTHAETAAPLH